MEDKPVSKFLHKVGFENFVANGNDSVEFKLIRAVEDFENDAFAFHPDMCHQIFGEGETIFGYENLRVKLYFAAGSLKHFVGMDYSDAVNTKLCDGVEPDNILEKLETVIPVGYTSNLDTFSACIEKEAMLFHPLGDRIHSFQKVCTFVPRGTRVQEYKQPDRNGHFTEKTFEIYKADGSVPKFQEYHRRMESFILWFIDAASLLDETDCRWKFFMLFEKYKTSEGDKRYAFLGYSAVYEFYSYPDKIRPKVAQMFLLPPFQKQGLAGELLSTIYNTYRKDNRVLEITVEDPSDDFEVLRDYVDSCDCMRLSSFTPDKLKHGFAREMQEEARKMLKMTKRQTRRVYEILRLRITDVNNEFEFKKFRLDVKERLNIPYKKQEADIRRMMRRKFDSEELQKISQVDDASRKTELESNFQNLFAHYKNILRRLNHYGPA